MKVENPEIVVTVREIAARTQVRPDQFTECPTEDCDATITDELHIINVTIPAVSYHCHRCGELGEIDTWKGRTVDRVSARQVFRNLI